MQKIIYIFFIFLFFSCSFEQSIEKNDYDYFTIKSYPEKKEFYPEESIKFIFNQDIAVASKSKITVICEQNIDCKPEIQIDKQTLTITDLPPNDNIQIVYSIGVKSTENKPLTFKNKENIYSSEEKNFVYKIGPKLPILKTVIPSKDTISKVYLIEFTDTVSLTLKNIFPQPQNILKNGNIYLLLFEDYPKKITIKNLKTSLRKGTLKEITFFPIKTVKTEDIKTTINCEDIYCEFSFLGKGLIAMQQDNGFQKCLTKCNEKKDNLIPQTTYSKDFIFFTTNGKEIKKLVYTTKQETAHIRISEVMHTPKNTPEKSWEFVELFNNSSMDFDLTNCVIDDNNDGKGADPFVSLSNQNILKPGDFAVIVAKESALIPILDKTTNLFTVDDTTIADAGLTSKESIQIKCPNSSKELKIIASFPGGVRTQRGFSVIINEDGKTCDSSNEGGSPGEEEFCE